MKKKKIKTVKSNIGAKLVGIGTEIQDDITEEQSKPILKEKYKIDIVSLESLILSSHVPFSRIKEY